jgi:hypothetical protein
METGDLSAQIPDSVSVVRGRVVDHETDGPLWGAAVSLASGPGGTRGIGTRVTGEDGLFLFRRVPPGIYRLRVTLLGYGDLRDTLRVSPLTEQELVLSLSTSPVRLEPIVVAVERQRPDAMRGFETRRQRMPGTFITREDIERRAPHVFTDLFRTVAGARVVPVGQFGNGVVFRGRCRPGIWMDGLRLLPTENLDALLTPIEIEAVEVYKGSFIPAEFGPSACGAIVIWTRTGVASPNPGKLWKQLLFAAGFVFLGWFLVG